MCGILGFTGSDQEEQLLLKMTSLLAHRGPDDFGTFMDRDAGVALAMRRLSIIDLHSGHQPMSNEDETIWIVFNGEIYNSPELRSWLEARGHRFATRNSDTEVLIHLYEEKGREMLHELNGMFAFVIYDQRRRELFAARDRMGIKPLYYWQGVGQFAFSSELKSLLVLPFIERQVDQQSLFHYMTLLYVPGDASIIKGVRRLSPGCSFIYDLERQQLELQQYWQPRFDKTETRSEGDWAEILRRELRAAVKRWTLSDVPIACSLSGGIDSSAIVGLLAELEYPAIKTYSLGFAGIDEQEWSELDRARQVAEMWGTEHHEIILEPSDLLNDLVSMVWHLDEPYGGGLPSWYVFREMGRDVKVGLTGTGGDELFGNYGKFKAYESDELLRAGFALRKWNRPIANILASIVNPIARVTSWKNGPNQRAGLGRRFSNLHDVLKQPFGSYYYANFLYLSDDRKRADVLQVQNSDLQNTASYLQGLYDCIRAPDPRNGLAAVDFRTQLAEEFLFMTDRFSMAHSLEARVPLLDHVLVETVFRIPSDVRTKKGDLKYLFKRAVADLLPQELLTAPKKGFVIPVELWLRNELAPLTERLLDPARLRRQGFFQPEFYERFVRPHLSGQAVFTWQVWAALMFQLWHVVFIEQGQHESPAYKWEDIC